MDMSKSPGGSQNPSPSDDHPRITARQSIFLGATVHFDGDAETQAVRVRNISAKGMMIDSATNRPIGLGLTADLKNAGLVRGRVAWTEGQRMGIAFYREIDPQRAQQKIGSATSKAGW